MSYSGFLTGVKFATVLNCVVDVRIYGCSGLGGLRYVFLKKALCWASKGVTAIGISRFASIRSP